MTQVTTPISGNFCWVELNTTDPVAAKRFYGELFGWRMKDMPTPMGEYTMAEVDDKSVCGLMKLPEEARKMGAPPHWLSYVAVDDVDASAEKARELGGTVLVPPMDAGPGRMAVLQDPTRGVLAIWRAQQSMGTWLYQEPNAVCWNELMTTNVDAAGKFYMGLFGWKGQAMQMPGMTYTVLKNGDQDAGGMMAFPPEVKMPVTSWTVYFAVASADGAVERAQKLGAKLHVPPTDIPNVGRFAVLEDPAGAVFAVLQGSA